VTAGEEKIYKQKDSSNGSQAEKLLTTLRFKQAHCLTPLISGRLTDGETVLKKEQE
jgi:hypothetical protein